MISSTTLSAATLVTVVALAVLHPGECASVVVAPKEGFQYLGSFKENTRSSSPASHYFASYNAGGWYQAQEDCADMGATIVMIQSAGELDAVQKFIREQGNTGNKFWTAGVYDEDIQGFKWGEEKGAMSLQYMAPWAAGHPETKTPETRIVVGVRSSIKFQTALQTRSYRYICET